MTPTQDFIWKIAILRNRDAEVIESIENNEKQIVLDKTAFYPLGGGQPNDEGRLIVNSDEYKVTNVKKVEGKIVHELDHKGLQNRR